MYTRGIEMTAKQTMTLLLYAQNYPLTTIAKMQGVCLTTIRERVKALAKNHLREFNNALGIRGVYRRNRDGIRNTTNFSEFQNHDGEFDLEWVENRIEKKF